MSIIFTLGGCDKKDVPKDNKSIVINETLPDNAAIKAFVKYSNKWVELLLDSQYSTAGKVIGRVLCDSNELLDIKKLTFKKSTDTKIMFVSS